MLSVTSQNNIGLDARRRIEVNHDIPPRNETPSSRVSPTHTVAVTSSACGVCPLSRHRQAARPGLLLISTIHPSQTKYTPCSAFVAARATAQRHEGHRSCSRSRSCCHCCAAPLRPRSIRPYQSLRPPPPSRRCAPDWARDREAWVRGAQGGHGVHPRWCGQRRARASDTPAAQRVSPADSGRTPARRRGMAELHRVLTLHTLTACVERIIRHAPRRGLGGRVAAW